MTNALYFDPQGTVCEVRLGENTLESLQRLVGGSIEAVTTQCGQGQPGFVNGEGRILGLPTNLVATVEVGYGYPQVGPLVVVGINPDTGDTTDVDPDYVKGMRALCIVEDDIYTVERVVSERSSDAVCATAEEIMAGNYRNPYAAENFS